MSLDDYNESAQDKSGIKVVHVLRESYDIYIGRAHTMVGPESKWKNPYVIGKDGNRTEVISKYSRYILLQRPDLILSLYELEGKTLGCWCKNAKTPNAQCHGDILKELFNSDIYLIKLECGHEYGTVNSFAGSMSFLAQCYACNDGKLKAVKGYRIVRRGKVISEHQN